MAIRFLCGSCGKKFRVKAEYAGRQSKCPSCGWLISVPRVATCGEDESPPTVTLVASAPTPSPPSPPIVPAALTKERTSENQNDEPELWEATRAAPSGPKQARQILLTGTGIGALLLIVSFGLVALRASGHRPIQSAPAPVLSDPQQPAVTNSSEPRYRILLFDIGKALNEEWGKDVFSVRLSRKVPKTVLKEIAREIESNKPRNPRTGIRNRRTVVFFYLPEVDAYGPEGPFGATWALSDLNGPPRENGDDVSIFGFTIDEEIKAVAKQPPPPGDPIGEWIEDSSDERFHFIYQRGGVFYLGHGGKFEQELVGLGPQPYRLFERKERSEAGDYYRINERGDLELRDNEGLAVVARRVQ